MPAMLSASGRASGAAMTSGARAVSAIAPSNAAPRRAPVDRAVARGVVSQATTKQTDPITAANAAKLEAVMKSSNLEMNLPYRHETVKKFFPTSLGVDDFMGRLETLLAAYGFTGDNSIACTNLCRDEVTAILKDKIEAVFGCSFNTNGLGGVITCGVTGFGAGLSHSPTDPDGREKYIFFSFPHIAIDGKGTVGSISRPGRAGPSCACGAMAKALGEFQKDGYSKACKTPGSHDAIDPEYSILKQRLARRLRYERADVSDLDLAKITAAAERTITADLEYLVSKAVDPKKADYAVITGVQIHNWASEEPGAAPSMEFVAPSKVYAVVNGTRINLDLSRVPPLSPRQLGSLASKSFSKAKKMPSTGARGEVPYDYLMTRVRGGHESNVQNSPSTAAWLMPEPTKTLAMANEEAIWGGVVTANPKEFETYITDMQQTDKATIKPIAKPAAKPAAKAEEGEEKPKKKLFGLF